MKPVRGAYVPALYSNTHRTGAHIHDLDLRRPGDVQIEARVRLRGIQTERLRDDRELFSLAPENDR
jgi:hypothetical protein